MNLSHPIAEPSLDAFEIVVPVDLVRVFVFDVVSNRRNRKYSEEEHEPHEHADPK
jgi:hypothetical protein